MRRSSSRPKQDGGMELTLEKAEGRRRKTAKKVEERRYGIILYNLYKEKTRVKSNFVLIDVSSTSNTR